MTTSIYRRALLKGGLLAGTLVPVFELLTSSAQAADLPVLDASDPTAKALGFVNDASKLDIAANPGHKADQRCGSCAQYQGKAGAARGGCNIFVGHSVPAAGYCKAWAKKPGTLR